MSKKIILIMVIVSVLLLVTTKKQEETVILYSSLEQFRGEELQKQLDEYLPNIKSKVVYMPTGKAAAKLTLEGTKTEADIVVGMETGYMRKVAGNMEDISGYSRIDYLEEFDPKPNGNKYLIWERQAGAFVVNTAVLEKYQIEAPKSYEDLLDVKYKNLISMPDPKSSGTGYFFLKNRVNTLGEKEAFEYFDKLEANVKQFPESGSGPIKLLNQGEIAIGLALTFQAANERNMGKPFEIIFPQEGSPYSLTSTSLVKGRNNNEDVMAVFDFVINDFIKYDKEYFSPETIYKGQKNLIENYPTDINYADMTGIEEIEEKERLLEKWDY